MKYLNFEDIVLDHNFSVTESRSQDCDVSVKLGDFAFSLPVIMSNMDSICNRQAYDLMDRKLMLHVYPRTKGPDEVRNYYNYMVINRFNCKSISVGVKQEWIDFITEAKQNNAEFDFITIDCALSYSTVAEKMIDKVKELYPESFLIVGNGNTIEWLEWLASKGVNAAKVGIGVSPSCRTRQYTGFGSTTVTDLHLLSERIQGRKYSVVSNVFEGKSKIELESLAKPLNIKLIADGGLKEIGDIAKAIRFGADMVMSGSLFADCTDLPAIQNGYYGNSTSKAKGYHKNVEGVSVAPRQITEVPQTLAQRIKTIRESLESSVSYAGGKTLKDLQNVFYKII